MKTFHFVNSNTAVPNNWDWNKNFGFVIATLLPLSKAAGSIGPSRLPRPLTAQEAPNLQFAPVLKKAGSLTCLLHQISANTSAPCQRQEASFAPFLDCDKRRSTEGVLANDD